MTLKEMDCSCVASEIHADVRTLLRELEQLCHRARLSADQNLDDTGTQHQTCMVIRGK